MSGLSRELFLDGFGRRSRDLGRWKPTVWGPIFACEGGMVNAILFAKLVVFTHLCDIFRSEGRKTIRARCRIIYCRTMKFVEWAP